MENISSTDFTSNRAQLATVQRPIIEQNIDSRINRERLLLDLDQTNNKFDNSEILKLHEESDNLWRQEVMTLSDPTGISVAEDTDPYKNTRNYYNTVTSSLDITNNNKPIRQTTALWTTASYNVHNNEDTTSVGGQWHDQISYNHQETSQYMHNSIKPHSTSMRSKYCSFCSFATL